MPLPLLRHAGKWVALMLDKGVAPISATAIRRIDDNYVPVKWTVLLVSLVSARVCLVAMRVGAIDHAPSKGP
ncbi:hypothetical protein BX589_112195 [Paraburkholderia fungorum]|jgi:hypothetical protein|nr:hypothetical protein BX589_112195 [Paraburkholderia fungorum]